MKSMKKTYGKDAKAVFYASKNKGVIKGVDRAKKKKSKKSNYGFEESIKGACWSS